MPTPPPPRDEEKHWWDDDPDVRAENLRFELALERTLKMAPIINGNGPHSTLKTWAQIVMWIGFPGVAAGFLIYVGSNTLPQIVKDLTALTYKVDRLRELHEEEIALLKTIARTNEQACRNAARGNESAANLCR
mgnify:CR=1 FL=1